MTESNIEELFQNIKNSIKLKEENSFYKLWNPEAYTRNLAGPEGWSGGDFYSKLVGEVSEISPELNDLQILEEPGGYIAGCYLNNGDTNQEYCYLLILKNKSQTGLSIWSASYNEEALHALWSKLSDTDSIIPLSHSKVETEQEKTVSVEEAVFGLFETFNLAIADKDEAAFADLWTAKGYAHNLSTDEGGLSGRELYMQASSQNWHISPLLEFSSLLHEPEAMIIPLTIKYTAFNIEKKGNESMLLLVNTQNGVKFLGYGTDLSSLRHLYLKFKSDY